MMRFARRLTIVILAAGVVVGIGFGLKQYDPVASYFSKDEGRTEELRAGPDSATGLPPGAGDASIEVGKDDEAADRTNGEVGAGDESVHPDEDKGSFEQWPSTDLGHLFHSGRIMLPIAGAVIGLDVIRKRFRKKKRLPRPSPAAA